MRFIGNLHTALRITDGEKRKIKELNSMLRENPEYGGSPAPTGNQASPKTCSKDRCLHLEAPKPPVDEHMRSFQFNDTNAAMLPAQKAAPMVSAASKAPRVNRDLRSVINFRDYTEAGYSMMPGDEQRPPAKRGVNTRLLASAEKSGEQPTSNMRSNKTNMSQNRTGDEDGH